MVPRVSIIERFHCIAYVILPERYLAVCIGVQHSSPDLLLGIAMHIICGMTCIILINAKQ